MHYILDQSTQVREIFTQIHLRDEEKLINHSPLQSFDSVLLRACKSQRSLQQECCSVKAGKEAQLLEVAFFKVNV